MNAEFFDFVRRHAADDPTRLRLRYHGDARQWLPLAITNIECARRAAAKLGDLAPRVVPSALSLEQSTSGPVARLHGDIARALVGERPGDIVDMTLGLGVDLRAIVEALGSLGRAESDFRAYGIERQPLLAEVARCNFADLEQVEIVEADSVEWLGKYYGPTLRLIFIDPARRGAEGERVYNIHDCQPDVAALLPQFAEKCHMAMVKLSPMLDLTQTLRDLPPCRSLHVVEEGGECRELLGVLCFDGVETGEAEIVVESYEKTRREFVRFAYTLPKERAAQESYGEPEAGMLLYEPSAAMMKARPFGLLCERYGLRKLHPNTHLFVAEKVVDELPGRWLTIEAVHPFASGEMRRLGKQWKAAQVAVRNFPLTAEQLRKKLGLKDGSATRLFGATTLSGPLMLVTRAV